MSQSNQHNTANKNFKCIYGNEAVECFGYCLGLMNESCLEWSPSSSSPSLQAVYSCDSFTGKSQLCPEEEHIMSLCAKISVDKNSIKNGVLLEGRIKVKVGAR